MTGEGKPAEAGMISGRVSYKGDEYYRVKITDYGLHEYHCISKRRSGRGILVDPVGKKVVWHFDYKARTATRQT